jgi:hypothetical protein
MITAFHFSTGRITYYTMKQKLPIDQKKVKDMAGKKILSNKCIRKVV